MRDGWEEGRGKKEKMAWSNARRRDEHRSVPTRDPSLIPHPSSLFDCEVEEHHAQRQKDRVEGDQQAQPLANLGRVDAG